MIKSYSSVAHLSKKWSVTIVKVKWELINSNFSRESFIIYGMEAAPEIQTILTRPFILPKDSEFRKNQNFSPPWTDGIKGVFNKYRKLNVISMWRNRNERNLSFI